MSDIQPFPALRPKPELAAQICELPYDVMSSDEAREMVRGNPLSFLHVSKPEIDLDPAMDPYDDRVYAQGRKNFKKLISEGALFQDVKPFYYLYRQIMGSHSQVGIVAAASCLDYEQNVIKKHELTRPDKEDDRVRHIEALDSQTGPVFLTYQAQPALDEFIAKKIQTPPVVDFTGKDQVRHSSWIVDQDSDIQWIRDTFRKIPALYVADGHHRSAAAWRVWKSRGKKSDSTGRFLSVIFPHNQMQILPYNRVVRDLNGLTVDSLLKTLGIMGALKKTSQPRPTRKHQICIRVGTDWYEFVWNASLIHSEDSIGQLDVSLLQKHILTPLLGIDDPRTSKRIQFVGGIRGTGELEKQVASGGFQIAFSMYPTRIEDLMKISDEGGLMPPKSTWFEPKLRDAMFCHLIEA